MSEEGKLPTLIESENWGQSKTRDVSYSQQRSTKIAPCKGFVQHRQKTGRMRLIVVELQNDSMGALGFAKVYSSYADATSYSQEYRPKAIKSIFLSSQLTQKGYVPTKESEKPTTNQSSWLGDLLFHCSKPDQ